MTFNDLKLSSIFDFSSNDVTKIVSLKNLSFNNLELNDNMMTFNSSNILMEECTLKTIKMRLTNNIILIEEGNKLNV